MCLDCCTQIEGLLKETGDELSECPLCQASVPELFVCEEADLIQKAILAAQCRLKMQTLLADVEAEPDSNADKPQKRLEMSALKPKRLEFSPANKIKLLSSEKKN